MQDTPAPLRVLVADDELLARKRLARLLAAIVDVEVVGMCEDGAEVLARVRDQSATPVDVIVLDIHMPGLSGMDALALLGENGPRVIFCTAHADHAVAAFEHGAVDYLVKPVDVTRLQKALDRARGTGASSTSMRVSSSAPPDAQDFDRARLPISTRKGIILLNVADVSHAILENEIVVVCTDDDRFLTDFSLNALEAKLSSATFERVHRRALINLDKVSTLSPLDTGGYLARMQSGDLVNVSRQAARRLRKRMGM